MDKYTATEEAYKHGYEKGYEAGKPKWIPASERLPTEADGTVMVCFPDVSPYNLKEPYPNAKHDRRVATGKYSQHSKRWYIGEFSAIGGPEPTFWMPLPEPPKEGE